MQASARPEPRVRESSPISLLSGWIQQGVDSYVATQRIVLDLVMRQNATTMNALRQRLTVPRRIPTTGLAELAGEGLSNFIEAQRVILDLASQQNEIVLHGVSERIGNARAAVVVDLMRRSIGTFIQMQRQFLTIAAKQTNAWMQETKAGETDPGRGLAELARDAMEQFVRTQKEFLDMIAEEAAKAADVVKHGDENGHKEPATTDLVEVARQSADSLINMQKKLLDVANRQVELQLKAARRVVDFTPSPRMDLADLTRQYVENFVTAQKALLDIMIKPRHTAYAADERERTVSHRAHRVATTETPRPTRRPRRRTRRKTT